MAKLKPIAEPMDLKPVLNNELLTMADWLTENTLCFKISALQAMLPAAMKAKYEKQLVVEKDIHVENLPEPLRPHFSKGAAQWKSIEAAGLLPLAQQGVKNGILEVVYKVKGKTNKKMIKKIYLGVTPESVETEAAALPPQAKKQRDVLMFWKDHASQGFTMKELSERAGTTASTIHSLVKKGLLVQQEEEIYRDPFQDRTFKQTSPLPLTDQQGKAITPIIEKIESGIQETFLLYGVTGSGKTEIYLQSIQRVLERGKEAIVLVPEIALTPQMVNRFKGRFGDEVAVLHSGLSSGEKYDEWRKIQRKEVRVVVGARSAVFAPFENIGIIIIDEEHETSYKQEENPRYHARDVAIIEGNSTMPGGS